MDEHSSLLRSVLSCVFCSVALVLCVFSAYLSYRFHMIDKRFKNRSKNACILITLNFILYISVEVSNEHLLNTATSVSDFFTDACSLIIYMFFLHSLLGILEVHRRQRWQ